MLNNIKSYEKFLEKQLVERQNFLKKLSTKKQIDYLDVLPNPCDRKFYLLSKIHKEKNTWVDGGRIPSGRPIV